MIDVSKLENFAVKMEQASAGLKPFVGEVLDDAGEEFLDIVQDEIMRAGNLDTRLLLNSFSKGSGYGIYELDLGALTLTVGTRVEYAKWVNKGHPQRPGRFIPGVWNGDRFEYIPGAKTGMVLKASKVEGSHFFDKSVEVLRRMFPEMAQAKFNEYISRYFG
jgi:hypothetical protein